MTPVYKKKEARYSYALDENDNLIHINTLYRQLRLNGELGRFFCPGCNREMRACLPQDENKRIKYFAHDSKGGCGEQTYLHQLAKLKLKEKFDSDDPFRISVRRHIYCRDYKECPFFAKEVCQEEEVKEFDLHEQYDTCALETGVDTNGKHYIADLLLSNSKIERPPVLIEIAVTHFVEEEKRKSGLRIIELPVKSEEDIGRFSTGLLEEPDNKTLSVKAHSHPRFYGFKKSTGVSNDCLEKRKLIQAIIEPYGLTKSGTSTIIRCSNRGRQISQSSIMEIDFPLEAFNNNIRLAEELAYCYAIDSGFRLRPILAYVTKDKYPKMMNEIPFLVVRLKEKVSPLRDDEPHPFDF